MLLTALSLTWLVLSIQSRRWSAFPLTCGKHMIRRGALVYYKHCLMLACVVAWLTLSSPTWPTEIFALKLALPSLQLLDSIHNAAIRLCTGAYRSSPVVSLYADSGEMSLSLRRDQLLLQYYALTLQLPSSAMFPYVQPPQHPPIESIPIIATLELNLNLNIACLPFT